MKQQRAGDGFELLDGGSDCRLGNIQVNRRLRNLPDLGGGDEITDLAQAREIGHSTRRVSAFQKIPRSFYTRSGGFFYFWSSG